MSIPWWSVIAPQVVVAGNASLLVGGRALAAMISTTASISSADEAVRESGRRLFLALRVSSNYRNDYLRQAEPVMAALE